jgi:hypothetical protein
MKRIRIGNGAGFWGDNLDAPRRLVESAELDYLTLEYLAELTLSILARLKEKDPTAGYAHDILPVMRSLVPALKAQPKLKIVTNAGGMNPASCAKAVAAILAEAGLGDVSIGVVSGDDLLPQLSTLQQAGCRFENLDDGRPLADLKQPIVSANAYLGAKPIAEALAAGARIVITGRVADASLTAGPAMHEFGWAWDDWNKLAAASVAGHLIECGAQATGGYSHAWDFGCDLAKVGYPIAELEADGSFAITQPPNSDGCFGRDSVRAQLFYEIGDPQHYLTPDVDCDFTTVTIGEAEHDRVAVRGATGRAAPSTLKVSLAYRDGFMADGRLLVYGKNCLAKADACAKIIWSKLRDAGYEYARKHVEFLGSGWSIFSDPPPVDLREVVLRMAVHDPRREAVERFTREFAPLATSGPAGLAGYTQARGEVRPVFAYWPTLVPRELLRPSVEVRTVKEWA